MQPTFYTEGRHLFDPTGKKVTPCGINKRSVQDESDPKGYAYFAEIRKTGANSVRIAWAITKDLKPGGPRIIIKSLRLCSIDDRKIDRSKLSGQNSSPSSQTACHLNHNLSYSPKERRKI